MAETLKIANYGQGTPLVLIHGWGLNSGIWQPLLEPLAQHYKVITVDLPGFGDNVDMDLCPYSLSNVVDMVANSIDERAIYLGWSLGGLIATELACRYPEKVRALITTASSPCFIANGDWPGIKAEVLAGFHQMLSQNIKKTIDNFLKIQAMGSEHIRHDIKVIRELIMAYPLPSKNTLDDSLALLETIDIREQLPKISVPFLRLYGKLDTLVPKQVACLLKQQLPNSEQFIFDKASHAPFISHQQAFVEVLTRWLAQQGK